MGIRVRRGRGLADTDEAGAPPVAVVSQRLASRLFGERDPMGHAIQLGPPRPDGYTIVGVVDDVKQTSLADGDPDGVYIAAHQWHWADPVRWVTVRTGGDPTDLLPFIRRAIWSVDGDQPVVRAQSMETLVADSEDLRRFVLLVMSAFGLTATALAIIGLFGVLSGMVAERLPELGIRAALGAPRKGIVALVVRQGVVMTAVGVALGALLAAAASRALATLLFEVSTLDPITYVAVTALLVLAGGVACIVPASRAATVDPVRTLKAD
ncbi:MAG: FtsX-like permease family protein [Gemmatimonadota bacterium]